MHRKRRHLNTLRNTIYTISDSGKLTSLIRKVLGRGYSVFSGFSSISLLDFIHRGYSRLGAGIA
jgi:hypothetical protein